MNISVIVQEKVKELLRRNHQLLNKAYREIGLRSEERKRIKNSLAPVEDPSAIG